MKLTVATLRSILNEIGDDVILADLDYGNGEFHAHDWIKRLLLLKTKEGKEYLTINRMGSHFTGKESQSHLKYAERYWDEDSVLKISSKLHVSGQLLAQELISQNEIKQGLDEETLPQWAIDLASNYR